MKTVCWEISLWGVCACVCLYVDEKQPSKGDGEIQQYGAKKEKEIE